MGSASLIRAPDVPVFARYGFLLATLSLVAGLISGPGYRLGLWSLGIGFGILRWACYLAVIAALLSLTGTVVSQARGAKRGITLGIAGVLLGVATFAWPAVMLFRARQVPPIHDITTDTVDPPRFVAILPLRADAANPTEYGGPDIAAQQRKAYPRIGPSQSKLAPDQAFERALTAARDMGWTIVAAVPPEGRIEATATTLFYGFKDDIVVRVKAVGVGNGSRIDVRSESRVGKSDIGMNARRVEAFLKRIETSSSLPVSRYQPLGAGWMLSTQCTSSGLGSTLDKSRLTTTGS